MRGRWIEGQDARSRRVVQLRPRDLDLLQLAENLAAEVLDGFFIVGARDARRRRREQQRALDRLIVQGRLGRSTFPRQCCDCDQHQQVRCRCPTESFSISGFLDGFSDSLVKISWRWNGLSIASDSA